MIYHSSYSHLQYCFWPSDFGVLSLGEWRLKRLRRRRRETAMKKHTTTMMRMTLEDCDDDNRLKAELVNGTIIIKLWLKSSQRSVHIRPQNSPSEGASQKRGRGGGVKEWTVSSREPWTGSMWHMRSCTCWAASPTKCLWNSCPYVWKSTGEHSAPYCSAVG